MFKILLFLTFLISFIISKAQTDTVYMYVEEKLISEYKIIIKQNDVYVREQYTDFKHVFWLIKIDTVLISKFEKTANGFSDLKGKKPIVYKSYLICDSVINNIRNNAAYFEMENEIRDLANNTIGYDNYDIQEIRSENWLATRLLHKLCYQDYKELESKLKQKYILCIDSLYAEKENRLNWIKSNPNSITQAYVDNFIQGRIPGLLEH